MIRFIRDYFEAYYLLFFLSYLSIYFFPSITSLFSISILLASYYLIIARQRFDVVIALIVYSKGLNGFVFLHNETAYLIVNLMTNVLPMLLYFLIVLSQNGAVVSLALLRNYKYTLLFFIFLTTSYVYNFFTSYDLITKRYLPFAFFVLFLFAFTRVKDFNVNKIIRFFRIIFLASLVIYFFSDYLTITRELVESDSIFSVTSQSNSFSLSYFSFTRNMGPMWDHRILAIFAYLFLLLCLIFKSKYLKIDILLSLIVVVTSLSRGAILTYFFILIAYVFQIERQKSIVVLTSLSLLFVASLFFAGSFFPEEALNFLNSFNPFSEDNALDQRAAFANYALEAFFNYPIIGNGVGALTSSLIDRAIVVDGSVISVTGDAFWYILLAEMGVLGFLFYFLFLKEVFLTRSLLFVALFIGFSIQLLGTDIPDMRFYYFAILVIIVMAKNELAKKYFEPL